MEPECGRVICLKVVTDNFFKTNAMSELLQEEKSAIGRKFAAVVVIFELLIETERGVIF